MTFGIDIGTTSVAGVAVADGRIVASETLAHRADLVPTASGVAEQDPEKLAAAALAVISSLEKQVGKPDGIGWTGQMHGVVGVDRALKPVTPFVTWRDDRRFGGRILRRWAQEGRKIFKCLSVCGLVIARLTGRAVIDETFLHSWYPDEWHGLPEEPSLRKWLPEIAADSMLGDNQAGVLAARSIAPGCAVVNLGTSGQLSVVRDTPFTGKALPGAEASDGSRTEERPFPGGRTLVCRAAMSGGRTFADLREKLGLSWEEMNDTEDGRVLDCVRRIADDLVGDIDLDGVSSLVGVGNGLVRNPALRRAVEERFGLECIIPEIPEMAAYGAAMSVL